MYHYGAIESRVACTARQNADSHRIVLERNIFLETWTPLTTLPYLLDYITIAIPSILSTIYKLADAVQYKKYSTRNVKKW